MFMKNASGRAYALMAQVEVSKVRFNKTKELGIEFTNQIDVWSKMEFRFRQQISQLKACRKADGREGWKDTRSLIYSIREKLD
jgi:hypothetical protein